MNQHKHHNMLRHVFLICWLSLAVSSSAPGQCINGTTQSERDLWAVHNCAWSFVLWQYKAYQMFGDNWDDYGYNDACNIDLPYPKCVNASYLLSYGLREDLSTQWHGTLDYENAALAWSSPAHYQIYYAPSTSRDFIAHSEFIWRKTELGCLLFDQNSFNNNPSSRAGDYVHEGWHHWEYKRSYFNGHMDGPVDACTFNVDGCDWFYFHGVGDYAFGAMHEYNRDGSRFHSPNQAQVEFLCDIAEVSHSWVPASVRVLARVEANQRLAARFRNAVGYRCGDPRPW